MSKKVAYILFAMILFVMISVVVDILLVFQLRATHMEIGQHEMITKDIVNQEFIFMSGDWGYLVEPENKDSEISLTEFKPKEKEVVKLEGRITPGLPSMAEGVHQFLVQNLRSHDDSQALLKHIMHQMMKQYDSWTGAKVVTKQTGYLRHPAGIVQITVTLMAVQPLSTQHKVQRFQYIYQITVFWRFHAAPLFIEQGMEEYEGILPPGEFNTTQPGADEVQSQQGSQNSDKGMFQPMPSLKPQTQPSDLAADGLMF